MTEMLHAGLHSFDKDLIEMQLSHKVGTNVESAYQRSNSPKIWFKMMQFWADWLQDNGLI